MQKAFFQGPGRASELLRHLKQNGERGMPPQAAAGPFIIPGVPKELTDTQRVPPHLCDLSNPGTMIPTLQMRKQGLKLGARLINEPCILACSL